MTLQEKRPLLKELSRSFLNQYVFKRDTQCTASVINHLKQEQETFVEIREGAEYIDGDVNQDGSGDSSEDDPTIMLHANCMVFDDQQ